MLGLGGRQDAYPKKASDMAPKLAHAAAEAIGMNGF